MLRFSENLFLTANTKGKVNNIKLKLLSGIGITGICLITLSSNKDDVFDVYHASLLKQRSLRKRDFNIVGIAENESAAYKLISELISDCITKKDENITLREYFEGIIKW